MVQVTEAQEEFLKKPINVLVGTKRKDGSVQINPAWYEFKDGYFYLNSSKGRYWPEHIQREKQATLAFFDPDNFHNFIEAVVKLVEVTEEGAAEHIHELSRRYTGNDYPLTPEMNRIKMKFEIVRIYGSI